MIGDFTDVEYKGRVISEAQITKAIFCFATLGELSMSAATSDERNTEKFKKFFDSRKDLVRIISHTDYLDFKDFCLNAKEQRAKLFESKYLHLVNKLVKQSDTLSDEVRFFVKRLA